MRTNVYTYSNLTKNFSRLVSCSNEWIKICVHVYEASILRIKLFRTFGNKQDKKCLKSLKPRVGGKIKQILNARIRCVTCVLIKGLLISAPNQCTRNHVVLSHVELYESRQRADSTRAESIARAFVMRHKKIRVIQRCDEDD